MFSWIFFFIFILLEHWSGSVNIHVHHFWYFYPYTNELLSSDFFANVFLHNIYCKLKYYFLRTNSYKLYCIMTSESYGNWIGLRNCPLGDWRYAGSLSRDLVAMLLSRLKVLDNSEFRTNEAFVVFSRHRSVWSVRFDSSAYARGMLNTWPKDRTRMNVVL